MQYNKNEMYERDCISCEKTFKTNDLINANYCKRCINFKKKLNKFFKKNYGVDF